VSYCLLLDHAAGERRAVATDNVPDYVRWHRQRLEAGRHYLGLLLFTNDTFPGIATTCSSARWSRPSTASWTPHPQDDDSSWVRWLRR